MPTGPTNLITDVTGVLVGNADDPKLASGVTSVLFETPAIASGSILGGAPANRDTAFLEPENLIETIDAALLSGGSTFGLDATTGAQAWLREQGRGQVFGRAVIPKVPQAIVFDLMNGGDKDWGRFPPYRELGYRAIASAGKDFALGTAGGGYGASTVDLKGGLGSASAVTCNGFTVGAIVVVNAIGSAVIGGGPCFWAAGLEEGAEFGGLGYPAAITPSMRALTWKGGPRPEPATTIALVATDATLTKNMAKRMAIVAQGGLQKALRLAHALFDGDTVFACSTARHPRSPDTTDLIEIHATAADCLARAIARGVYEASALPFVNAQKSWRDRFKLSTGV
jgi:L-aminopeptidase/D-esterase-like protein